MKKIYMILAALTLLSLSLNAQLLPNRSLGTPKFADASAITGMQQHKGQSRAPLRLNAGEYTVGPFEGDNYSTGIGYLGYPDPQMILATVLLDRSEFIGHEGDSIVGFRFALYGDGTQTVRLGDFVSLFLSQNGYFDFDNSWMWTIGRLGSGSGSGHESETTTTTVTFTAANDHGTTTGNNSSDQVEKGGVTMYGSDAAFNASSNGTYTYRFYANSTTTFSVASGNITKIEFTGVSSYAVSNFTASTGTLTTSGNNGTWEGSASSVSFTAGSQVRCTQVVVTVESQAGGTVTVGDGATNSSYLPVRGYMQDYGYSNQMIYSANQLGLSSGAQITSLTFYPKEGTGINFYGSTVYLSLGNTTTSNFGTGTSGTAISPSDLTQVAGIRVTATDVNATSWTFTFDQPFTYTGGNLLVQIDCAGYYDDDTDGQWATSQFMGDTQSSNVSLRSGGTPDSFLPKATFAYTGSGGGGTGSDYVDLATGQWYDYYLDEPVEFIVPGDTVENLCIGYEYLQYPSGTSGQQLYPLAVNDESTTHDHLFYMTAGSSSSDEVTCSDGTYTGSGYNFMPVYGYYFERAQTNQMIYTASQLGLQQGDQITSLSFYPYSINFSGGSITISLANTTTDRFSSASPLSATMTQVAQVTSYTVNNGRWTIDFDTPFTYDGTNLLVQVATTAGSYGSTNFYGAQQTNMQSYNSYSGSRYYFLPKATFGYTRSNYQRAWYGLNLSQYGDLAVQLIFKPSQEKTPAPSIDYTYDNGYYYVTAHATDPNATVTLTVDGITATGTGSVQIPVGRGDTDRTVTATATAQEDGKAVSDPTTQNITILASTLDPTPAPTINSQVLDATVEVTGNGQGTVHMYIDGQEVTNPYYLERTTEEYTVTVTVTAQINDGDHSMSTTTQTVVVPPVDFDETGWTQLTGLFNNDEVIIWDNNLMFVDRFTASTAQNNQPLQYVYKMTENNTKLTTPLRETNSHTVPVKWTNSKVFGYYTEQNVLDDTLRQVVDLNLLNADVQMNLTQNNEIYYYTLDRSRNSRADADFIDLSHLQHDNARYVEFSEYYLPVYEPFNYGPMTRFDSIDVVLPASAPQGVDGKHYGTYDNGDYFAYVPIVWTFGNDPANTRANWDNDHLNNSYGSPIWQTGVGKVELKDQPQLERQEGKNGSTNWTEGDVPCSIFMITDLEAYGYLPNPQVSNIEYEPYMFRVWVESEKDILRNFVWVEGDPDDLDNRPGTHFEGTGIIPANTPFLVWEEPITAQGSDNISDGEADNVTVFHKLKVTETETVDGQTHWTAPQAMNMLFAAPDTLKSSDIKIYVRFYYKSTGDALHQNGMYLMGLRAIGDNGYYGVEGDGDPNPEIPTFIKGVYVNNTHGEVVSVTYYNSQGMSSSQPFDGMNIVVTRYSGGTSSTSKVMKVTR